MTEALTIINSELEKAADSLFQEDSRLLAARFHLMHEHTMRQLDEALKEARPGTATYLNHLIAREKLQANYLSTLMDLGLITRAPINYAVEKFEFKATVGLMTDGRRDVMCESQKVIEGDIVE